MRDAIRELDPKRPITLGVDPETLFRATGVDARAAIATCEFAVSHVTAAYRAYAAEGPITSGPSTYLDSFLLRAADRGKPVLIDDVGVLSLDNSAAEEAAAVRTALWSGLVNRASGALLRRFRDLETERREPYFLDPFETLVGVVDSDGELKPSFAEARTFVRAAARIDLKSYEPTPRAHRRHRPGRALRAAAQPRRALRPARVPDGVHRREGSARPGDRRRRGRRLLGVLGAHRAERVRACRRDVGAAGRRSCRAAARSCSRTAAATRIPAIRELFGVEFLGDGGPRERLSCRVAQDDVLGALDELRRALRRSPTTRCSRRARRPSWRPTTRAARC